MSSEFDFSRVAFVDGLRPSGRVYWQGKPGELRGGLLPQHILGCDALNWQERDSWDVDKYDLFIVFYFPVGSRVMQWIRRRRPDAQIVPWVDPGVDVAFWPPKWGENAAIMIRQIRNFADKIATWDPALNHGEFLQQLTGVPAVELPIPLLPIANINELRTAERENLIYALLHRQQPKQPAATLATVAALQQATGWRVAIADADETAKDMTKVFGVKAEFQHGNGWGEKFGTLCRARLYVDMYTIHHYGRVATHAANVGTVSVSSPWCADVGHITADPWSGEAARRALAALDDPGVYEAHRRRGFEIVARRHDPDRIKGIVASWLM